MSINNYIYDIRMIKYKCILAYFHRQLEKAEKMTNEGKGEICVEDIEYVRSSISKIKIRMEELKCTDKDMALQIRANPFLIPYYDTIGQTVKKHFPVQTPWIPSFLMLEVLRLFAEKNYKLFPESDDMDFIKLQNKFQQYKKGKDSNLPLHYKCAEDIFLSIEKKKVFKKKKRNK